MCGPAIDFGAPAILSIHPHGLQRTGLAGRCQTRFARLPLPPTRTGRGRPSCGAASTCCTARWPQPTRQYPDHSAGNPGYSPSRAHAAFPVQSALAAHPGGAVPPSPSQRPGLAHARRAKRLCKQKPRRGPALTACHRGCTCAWTPPGRWAWGDSTSDLRPLSTPCHRKKPTPPSPPLRRDGQAPGPRTAADSCPSPWFCSDWTTGSGVPLRS